MSLLECVAEKSAYLKYVYDNVVITVKKGSQAEAHCPKVLLVYFTLVV